MNHMKQCYIAKACIQIINMIMFRCLDICDVFGDSDADVTGGTAAPTINVTSHREKLSCLFRNYCKLEHFLK